MREACSTGKMPIFPPVTFPASWLASIGAFGMSLQLISALSPLILAITERSFAVVGCGHSQRGRQLSFRAESAMIDTPRSNQSMKPTAPLRCSVSVFATDPGRGLSLSREMTSGKSASCFWDLKNRRWRRRHRAEFGTPDPIATSQRLFGGSRASRPSRACRGTLRPFALR